MTHMDWKSLFFSAEGRIDRQTFWIGFAILFGVGVVINTIPGFGQLISIAMIWCWVCLFSKRLHDFDKTGWLNLVPVLTWAGATVVALLVGGVGLIAAAAGENQGVGPFFAAMGGVMLVFAVAGLVQLAFILWVGLTAPTPGENLYGPHPAVSLDKSST